MLKGRNKQVETKFETRILEIQDCMDMLTV